MANLFQPTFKASNLTVPNIPGADIGGFGKALADIELRNMKRQQFEADTRRAEEQDALARADRAELEASKDFLRNYDYNSTSNTNLLNKKASSAFNKDVKGSVEQLLRDRGITDNQGNAIEGGKYTPELIEEINAINAKTLGSLPNVPTTREAVFQDAFGKAIKTTGNYDLANKFATSVSSKHKSKQDFIDTEKTRVDTANDSIDRMQKLLVEQAKLDSKRGKKGDSDKANYAQNWDILQSEDYDVSLVDSFGIGDAGKVKNIISKGRDSGLEAWAVDKAIRNSIDRDSLGDKLHLSERSILDLAKSYNSGKTGSSSIPILERAKARSFSEIMKDEGDLAFDNRIGSTPRREPRSTPPTNSIPQGVLTPRGSTSSPRGSGIRNRLGGVATSTAALPAPSINSTPITNVQPQVPSSDLRELTIRSGSSGVPVASVDENGLTIAQQEQILKNASIFNNRDRLSVGSFLNNLKQNTVNDPLRARNLGANPQRVTLQDIVNPIADVVSSNNRITGAEGQEVIRGDVNSLLRQARLPRGGYNESQLNAGAIELARELGVPVSEVIALIESLK